MQVNLARVHAKLEFLKLANWKSRVARAERRAVEPGRRVVDQGVRHRVLHGSGAAPDGDHARSSADLGQLARRSGSRPRGAHAARHAHPHVRRRHQRDATRPDLDLRPQHARQPAAERPTELRRGSRRERETTRWISHFPKNSRSWPGWRRASSKTAWTLQHLKERDRSDDWYDLDTWREFAKANLLGIALPEIGRRPRPRLRRPVHGVARGRPLRRTAAARSRRS